jgi:hypothetical protein
MFWLNLVPELLGRPLQNPAQHYEDPSKPLRRLTSATVSPLPDDVPADHPNWQAEFEKVGGKRPMVVRKLIQREPARFGNLLQLANSEGLQKLFQNKQVPVFTHMTKDKSAVKMNFSRYVELLKQQSADMTNTSSLVYARALHDDSGTIMNSIDSSWLAGLWSGGYAQMLMTKALMADFSDLFHIFSGSRPSWTQCHCDISTTNFMMIEGRKRWVFYSPSQTPFLYPYGQMLNSAYNTAVDVHHPDMASFPEFKKAEGYEVTLEPGDVLFFPSMWWHAVENLDPISTGMDFAFIDILGSLKRNPVFTIASLLNPNLIMTSVRGILGSRGLLAAWFDMYLVDEEEHKERIIGKEKEKEERGERDSMSSFMLQTPHGA